MDGIVREGGVTSSVTVEPPEVLMICKSRSIVVSTVHLVLKRLLYRWRLLRHL